MAAIVDALKERKMDEAIALIVAGADPNAVNSLGQTPLQVAVMINAPDVVLRLLKAGAMVNQTNRGGFNPIYVATAKWNLPIVKILLDHGADPTMTGMNGKNAITHSVLQIPKHPAARAIYEAMIAVATLPPATAAATEEFQVLCDPVGFDQHIGECWIDSIQEAFFFTDKVKDFTQFLFYTMTDAQLEEYLETAIREEVFPPSKKETYRQGFNAMKTRFQNHYNMIRTNEALHTCSREEPLAVRRLYNAMLDRSILEKRAASGELAVTVARRFQSSSSKKDSDYHIGGSTNHTFLLLARMFYIFRLPFLIKTVELAYTHLLPIYGLQIHTSGYIIKDKEFTREGQGAHATAFLKCGGAWFYYDDNNGIFPVDPTAVRELIQMYSTSKAGWISRVIKVLDGKVYFFLLDGIITINRGNYENGNYQDDCVASKEMDTMKYDFVWAEGNWRQIEQYKTRYGVDSEIMRDVISLQEDLAEEGALILTDIACIVEDPSKRVKSKSKSRSTRKVRSA